MTGWNGPMAKTCVYVQAERVTVKLVVSKQFQCPIVWCKILQGWAGNYKRALEFFESRVPCQVPLSSYIIQIALKRQRSGGIINFVPRV